MQFIDMDLFVRQPKHSGKRRVFTATFFSGALQFVQKSEYLDENHRYRLCWTKSPADLQLSWLQYRTSCWLVHRVVPTAT